MNNSFYNLIKEYYDDIFPLNNKQVSFVKYYFKDFTSKLLEVGCANGKLTNALALYNITGIDLEKEFINIAKKRYPKPIFYELNMLNIDMLTEEYDGIICFGNTLVHLDYEQIRIFIDKAYKKLKSNGIILIQILNYDYILDEKISVLPQIDNPIVTFEREYQHGKKFMFNTKLKIKKENKIIENSIELYPIRKNTILKILTEAGFENIEIYGDFEKKPLRYQSLPLIIKACKQ